MEFFLVAWAHFLALLSPGPDFFLIIQTALRLPLRYAFGVCLGIALGNGVYIALALSSAAFLTQHETFFVVVRSLGGVYLCYIGWHLLRAPKVRETSGHALHVKAWTKHVALGFGSAVLNPKNALFYWVLFGAMVSPDTGMEMRLWYGAWMVAVVLAWDMVVALLAGNRHTKARLYGAIGWIQKGSGVVLGLFGLGLLVGL